MFGANAQLIATRCVQSFRGRVFSVRSLVQHTSDRKWSEHSLFGVRADNRSVDTSSQISGPNHALTLSFNLLIDSFKDTFWRACGRGSRIVLASFGAKSSSSLTALAVADQTKLLAAKLACSIHTVRKMDFVVQFTMTVGAHQFKAFGVFYNFLNVGTSTLSLTSVDVMEVECV
jgi:hypothetical protein